MKFDCEKNINIILFIFFLLANNKQKSISNNNNNLFLTLIVLYYNRSFKDKCGFSLYPKYVFKYLSLFHFII